MKFPGIAATFPQPEAEFADFGQELQKSGAENEKFAAKFAEAGNLPAQEDRRGGSFSDLQELTKIFGS